MPTRRSFFKRLAAIVAVVVIAPEIAFRAKLPVKLDWGEIPFWTQTTVLHHYYSDAYVKALELAYKNRA